MCYGHHLARYWQIIDFKIVFEIIKMNNLRNIFFCRNTLLTTCCINFKPYTLLLNFLWFLHYWTLLKITDFLLNIFQKVKKLKIWNFSQSTCILSGNRHTKFHHCVPTTSCVKRIRPTQSTQILSHYLGFC